METPSWGSVTRASPRRAAGTDRALGACWAGLSTRSPRRAGCIGSACPVSAMLTRPSPAMRAPIMIEAFKSEEVVDKFGGRFRLTAVIRRRLVQPWRRPPAGRA